MKSLIESIRRKIPNDIYYILLLFLSTRIVLSIIGVIARVIHAGHPMDLFSVSTWINIWSVWDAGWYLRIANIGYATIDSDIPMQCDGAYAFFPLYPLLIRLFGTIIGDFYIAGLIISNVCLLIASLYLYKLIKLDWDDITAKKTVKYLYLFPTAFIFSGVFTESLFLALLVMCFYYAKKDNWLYVGLLGFLLSMTRLIGVITLLPLLIEYMKIRSYNPKRIDYNILYLSLLPLGLFLFMSYEYYLCGDFLAFAHISAKHWGTSLTNPLQEIIVRMNTTDISILFETYISLICLILIILSFNKIEVSYWLLGIYSILIPFASGPSTSMSMARFLIPIFPLFLIFAFLSKNKYLDELLPIVLTLLQGCVMIYWTTSSALVI